MRFGKLVLGSSIILVMAWVIVGETGVAAGAGLADLQRAQTRLAREAGTDLTVSIDGVLWEVLIDDGEYVERRQDIAKFMACGSALVTLSAPDNVYAGHVSCEACAGTAQSGV